MDRKTKIVATLGPATCTEAQIRELIAEGLDIVRLNGSHNTLAWHRGVIRRVRTISPLIPILLDIPGRKVRTGLLASDVPLKRGETLVFTTEVDGVADGRIPVTYCDLHLDLRPGNIVLADDGTLKFQVIDVRGRDIVCHIENDGILRSSKGLNVPYVKLNGPVLADRDRRMLKFAKAEGVDFVGVSFVESAEHVAQVRELLEGSPVGIVSKIENKFGLDRLREIIVASDAVMIDRGDLTAETEIESLAIMQKRILREAQRHAKPVIVATEMLHTMMRHPYPTKAEVTDISAAVLDGASAIMLSGETAIGDFPAQAIALMNRVASLVENAETLPDEAGSTLDDEAIPSAVGGAIHELCRKLPVTKVICLTASGFAENDIEVSAQATDSGGDEFDRGRAQGEYELGCAAARSGAEIQPAELGPYHSDVEGVVRARGHFSRRCHHRDGGETPEDREQDEHDRDLRGEGPDRIAGMEPSDMRGGGIAIAVGLMGS